jgi:hypothetical protein
MTVIYDGAVFFSKEVVKWRNGSPFEVSPDTA